MLVTNGKAGVVQKYAYDAYGNNYEGSFAGSNNIGYNGKRYDGGTGWYDYGFRDYDSRTGRFTTQDPARDGVNWWNYCCSNPILRVDRTGFDDYIFYNFDDFSEQASREYEKLVNARNGDESKVHLVSTKTAEKFKTDWENMSNPETVTMIFHGNETGITLNYEDPYSDMNGFLTSNENGITKNGNKALRIQDLKKFDITTLKLFSCQSGNINEENNLAITFQRNMNINKVIASDGNLSFTKTGDPKVSHKGSKEYREKYSEKPAGLVTYQEKENKKTGKKENVVKEIINFKDFFVDLIN